MGRARVPNKCTPPPLAVLEKFRTSNREASAFVRPYTAYLRRMCAMGCSKAAKSRNGHLTKSARCGFELACDLMYSMRLASLAWNAASVSRPLNSS